MNAKDALSVGGYKPQTQFHDKNFDYANKKPFSDYDEILKKKGMKQDFFITIQETTKSEKYVNLEKVGFVLLPVTYIASNGRGKCNLLQTSKNPRPLYKKIEIRHRINYRYICRLLKALIGGKAFVNDSDLDDTIKAVASGIALGRELKDGRKKVILPLVIVANKKFDSGFVKETDPESGKDVWVGVARFDDVLFINANYCFTTNNENNTIFKYR